VHALHSFTIFILVNVLLQGVFLSWVVHCKKNLRHSLICSDHTFLELGLGKLFPARERLVSDNPAGDGNTAKPCLQCTLLRLGTYVPAAGPRARCRTEIQTLGLCFTAQRTIHKTTHHPSTRLPITSKKMGKMINSSARLQPNRMSWKIQKNFQTRISKFSWCQWNRQTKIYQWISIQIRKGGIPIIGDVVE